MPGSALRPDTQIAGTSLGGAWTRTIVAGETILSGRRTVTGDTRVPDNLTTSKYTSIFTIFRESALITY